MSPHFSEFVGFSRPPSFSRFNFSNVVDTIRSSQPNSPTASSFRLPFPSSGVSSPTSPTSPRWRNLLTGLLGSGVIRPSHHRGSSYSSQPGHLTPLSAAHSPALHNIPENALIGSRLDVPIIRSPRRQPQIANPLEVVSSVGPPKTSSDVVTISPRLPTTIFHGTRGFFVSWRHSECRLHGHGAMNNRDMMLESAIRPPTVCHFPSSLTLRTTKHPTTASVRFNVLLVAVSSVSTSTSICL